MRPVMRVHSPLAGQKSPFVMLMVKDDQLLSLQIGDDLHNTMPGLCSTITVTAK